MGRPICLENMRADSTKDEEGCGWGTLGMDFDGGHLPRRAVYELRIR